MATTFHFSLVSPERELFAGEASSVSVPGGEGTLEVLAGHAPLMTTLSPGMLVIRTEKGEEQFFVRGGFADATPNGLTVLAEVAVPAAELTGELLAAEKAHADALASNEEASADDRVDGHRAQDVLSTFS